MSCGKSKLYLSSFLIVSLLTLILNSQFCHAIPIFVKVKGVEKGDISYFNVSKIDYKEGYLTLSGTWENDGSVGCRVWMKVEIFNNNSDLVFISWSHPQSVAPGGVYDIYNFWYFGNKTGKFILKPIFYYCDKIEILKPILVYLKPHNVTKPRVINNTAFVYKNRPNVIIVKLNESISQGVYEIIPTYNPLGFRFYPVKIKINASEKEFSVPYYYNFLRPVEINAVMIGLNKSNSDKVYLLKLSTKIVKPKTKKPIFSLKFYSYTSLFLYFFSLYLAILLPVLIIVKFFNKKGKKNE